MMSGSYSVHVLKEGYSRTTDAGDHEADGTITLIQGRLNIIVDTGGPGDARHIITKLAEHSLRPEDINYVVGTHGHSDHIGNLNLFPHVVLIVGFDVCKGNTYFDHDFKNEKAYSIDTDVDVIATPGHMGHDVSVVVRGTTQGTVVVAGDLFECEADLTDENIWKENSEHPDLQAKNRQKVLSMADVIIPGHGPKFDVTKES